MYKQKLYCNYIAIFSPNNHLKSQNCESYSTKCIFTHAAIFKLSHSHTESKNRKNEPDWFTVTQLSVCAHSPFCVPSVPIILAVSFILITEYLFKRLAEWFNMWHQSNFGFYYKLYFDCVGLVWGKKSLKVQLWYILWLLFWPIINTKQWW